MEMIKHRAKTLKHNHLYKFHVKNALRNIEKAHAAGKEGRYNHENYHLNRAQRFFRNAQHHFFNLHKHSTHTLNLEIANLYKRFHSLNDKKGKYKPELNTTYKEIQKKEKQKKFHHTNLNLPNEDLGLLMFGIHKPSTNIERLKQFVNLGVKNENHPDELQRVLKKAGWPEYLVQLTLRKCQEEQDLVKLSQYIEARNEKGYNEQGTIQQLLSAGWDQERIDIARFKAHHIKKDTSNINSYVLHKLSNNVDKEQIYHNLSRVGWDEKTLKEIINY